VEDVSFRVVGLPPSKPCIRHRAAYAAARTLTLPEQTAGHRAFISRNSKLRRVRHCTLLSQHPGHLGRKPVTGRRPPPANLDHMDYNVDYSHRYTCTVARLTHTTIQPRLLRSHLACARGPLPCRVLMNHPQRDNEVRVPPLPSTPVS
jgi:hypothetical protein